MEPTGFLSECVRFACDDTDETAAAGGYARAITTGLTERPARRETEGDRILEAVTIPLTSKFFKAEMRRGRTRSGSDDLWINLG